MRWEANITLFWKTDTMLFHKKFLYDLSVKSIHISIEIIQKFKTSYLFPMCNKQGLRHDFEAGTLYKLRGLSLKMQTRQSLKKKIVCIKALSTLLSPFHL